MIGLAAAIHEAFSGRDWSKEERDSIEDVLDAAAAFTSFRLPLEEALKVGMLPDDQGARSSAGFARVRAVLAAHPSDPRRKALLDMLDIVVRAQPGIATNHGWFTNDEIAKHGIVIRTRPRAQAA